MNPSRLRAFTLRLFARMFLVSALGSYLLAANPTASSPLSENSSTERLVLRDHWSLQSSAQVTSKGEIVSTAAFVPQGWHDASVPTTVVAALVKDKTLPDPLFAMNLRQFAGVKYPIGENFSNIGMPHDRLQQFVTVSKAARLVPPPSAQMLLVVIVTMFGSKSVARMCMNDVRFATASAKYLSDVRSGPTPN